MIGILLLVSLVFWILLVEMTKRSTAAYHILKWNLDRVADKVKAESEQGKNGMWRFEKFYPYITKLNSPKVLFNLRRPVESFIDVNEFLGGESDDIKPNETGTTRSV